MKQNDTAIKKPVPKNVDEYLAMLPPDIQAALEKLRKSIKAILPDSTEVISYQIPTVKHKGRALLAYGGWKNHCSIYTMSKSIMDKLSKELEPYEASGVTIHFPSAKILPATLLKKIIKERLIEHEAAARKKAG